MPDGVDRQRKRLFCLVIGWKVIVTATARIDTKTEQLTAANGLEVLFLRVSFC